MAKNIDRQALIQKLKEEPQNLTNDEKAQIIEFINTKRYGLVWEDSTEKAYEQMKDYIPVLVEDENLRLVSDNDDAPNHILIEGDNLHALHSLCATHEGKVDMIYIDPPYNTGNNDFVYFDNYKDAPETIDKDHPFRHSRWLSFMSLRMKIAKRLLRPEGILFISLDDNEQSHMTILCDEIFGVNNRIAILPTIMNLKGNQDQYGFAGTHEYTLVYTRNRASAVFGEFNVDESELENWLLDNVGYYKKGATLKRTGDDAPRERRPYGYFPILVNNLDFTVSTILEDEYSRIYDRETKSFDDRWVEELKQKYESLGYSFLLPSIGNVKASWRWGYQSVNTNKNEIIVVNGREGLSLYKKQRPELGDIPTKKPKSLFYKAQYSSGNGTSLLEEILGAKKFNNPKPIELIHDFLQISTNKSSVILDFFAGSGTTLHATMQLNAEDGGHRKCILVTNNENNICEEVTYERNKRVINGYTKPNGEHVPGLTNNTLRYYRTRFVPREKDLTNVMRFARNSVSLLCIKHDVYNEQEKIGNLTVNKKQFRYFKEGAKQFIVILDVDMIEPITKELANMETEIPIPTYVFTTGNYPYTEDFWQVSQKVELYPYPTCIYGACEKDMPKMEDKLIDQPENIELTDDEANFSYEDLSKAENYPS